ncbi:IS66 family insertion sequence element accessory protein TnpB [Candidatus Margulisiibacteriota bacterium]
MFSFIGAKIWFYRVPVDFRKQIDGLVTVISDHLAFDPTSGQVFIFRSKRADRIKILYWEKNGFWLLYKRLEKGRFKFPQITDRQLELTSDQLNWLLSGLDLCKHQPAQELNPDLFY